MTFWDLVNEHYIIASALVCLTLVVADNIVGNLVRGSIARKIIK